MIIRQSKDISDDIKNDYTHLLSEKNSGKISLLYIHSGETGIAAEDSAHDLVVLSLDMGSETTGSAYFHHQPPTPDEVENAINTVEDELSLAYPELIPETVLYSKDHSIKEIALLAGISGTGELIVSRSSIEDVFTRFAKLSMGGSVKSDVIPLDPAFAATLLILREIMHHLKFENITLI